MFSCLRIDLINCNEMHWANTIVRLSSAYNDMYFLIDKYAPFPDGGGPKRLVDTEMATLSAERDHTL